MRTTGSRERTERDIIRGLRLKVQPVDDYCDIPTDFIPKLSDLAMTTEGFREVLVYGSFPDARFPEDV